MLKRKDVLETVIANREKIAAGFGLNKPYAITVEKLEKLKEHLQYFKNELSKETEKQLNSKD